MYYPRFLFLAFNQQQRHTTARSVTAIAKSKTSNVRNLLEITETPTFVDEIDFCIANPESASAKSMLRSLDPMIQIASAKVGS